MKLGASAILLWLPIIITLLQVNVEWEKDIKAIIITLLQVNFEWEKDIKGIIITLLQVNFEWEKDIKAIIQTCKELCLYFNPFLHLSLTCWNYVCKCDFVFMRELGLSEMDIGDWD